MNKFTRMAVGALTVAAVIAPLSTVTAASALPAVGKDWTTLESLNRAKQQACKVSVDEGTAWKIYNRLDARMMPRRWVRIRSTLTATRSGVPTARDWDSGWVRHGNVSAVGTFKIPKTGPWALTMSIYGDNAGSGGELTADDIRHC